MRAVHIHLSVTRLVEPRPRPDCITSLGFGGNGEVVDLVLAEDVSTSRTDAIADERFDDFPSRALIKRERNLARAAIVRGVALSLEGRLSTCDKGLG